MYKSHYWERKWSSLKKKRDGHSIFFPRLKLTRPLDKCLVRDSQTRRASTRVYSFFVRKKLIFVF